MSTTYHSLAAGSLVQNWSNAGLITTNDDWSGVASITGYLGNDVTATTGTDPRTLTAAGSGDVDAIANQANPNTLNTGGAAEFDGIANPTVALNGSGTADAPSLILYLDASNRQDVRVQFNARDIDGTADDAQQQLNVQYRIGPSGSWTNVTGGYFADVTTANTATQVTMVDVTLPAAANNQSQVEVRIITTNAVGNDEWVGIDDINVSSAVFSGGSDTTAPILQSSSPADNAAGVVISSDIVMTFDEAVKAGTGDIVVSSGGDTRIITLGTSDPDGTVTFNGNQVTINLATNLNNGTSYDVTMASGVIEDAAGNDFAGIAADALDFTTAAAAGAITQIYDIQGAGHVSALVGQSVTTQGVVTAVAGNGFYIQAAIGDGNAATSDGIFVFTGSAPTVTLGHLVQVAGTVAEFTDGSAAPGSLSITELTSPVVTDMGAGSIITATQIGGSAGLKPPTSNLDDDGLTTFDPVNDGIDFFESLEGMLVTLKTPVAVSPTNSFGEIFTIVDNDDNPANGLNTNSLTARGGVGISGGQPSFGNTNTVGGDFNPERIQIDDGILSGSSPAVSVGAKLGDVTGVVSYGFGNYEVQATQSYSVTTPSALVAETTTLVGGAHRLTVANYNVENLDPGDGAAKFNTLAAQIVNNLKAPDILSLQEVQDNNGATNDTIVSAATTLQMLVDAISAASGGTVQYAFQDNPFIGDDLNGGEPGGNIRNAFLYRIDRGVDLIESSLRTIDANGAATTVVGGNSTSGHPFFSSRPPLVADFTFNGETITIIDNHFSSKTGSGALMGTQPPLNSAEPARAAQAQAVNTFVDSLLAANSQAKVMVAGDLNEFEFEEPMQVLSGKATYVDGPDADTTPEYTVGGVEVLLSMAETLPINQRYDYVFDGSSQSLDQMYVTNGARAGAQYDIVHINAEFANQASDHDALVASIDMSAEVSITSTGALDITLKGALTLAGAEISAFDAGSDRLFTTSNAGLQVVNLANPSAPTLITTINFTALGFATTDVTSVAVKNGIVAVALPAADKTLPGKVVFLNAADHTLLGSVNVGALPDMLVFTPDGKKVLVANEGEFNTGGTDAEGSVSIIDISGGIAAATVQTAGFTAFNGQEAALRAEGVRIFAGRSVSQDVEPEYIAISADGTKAMITLQEANALAILDIATATIVDIVPLGLKDWTGLQLDISDRDGPGNGTATKLVTDSHLFGMYMPDAIASYQVGGQTFYVMANEGDDRDDFQTETIRVGSGSYDLDNGLFPNEAALKANAALGRHNVSNATGLRGDTDGDGDIDQILTYGGRSFSIVDSQGHQVFDSADVLERIIVQQFPSMFDDARSDNKGPEPEGLTIGTVDGRTYAFVALERAHLTLAFDITDPAHVSYAGAAQHAGDLNPEGVLMISAADSPTGEALLVVSNEVSNNLTVFSVETHPAYVLQLLHLSDGEAGLLAGDTAPYLAALLDAFDDDYANTLILAGGDNFLPGPFVNGGTDPSLNNIPGIGLTAPGRPDIAMLNAMGIEASTIGNHEWDLGSTAFRDAFTPTGAWGGALFPYLSANLDFSGDSALAPRFTNTVDGNPNTPIAEASTLKGRIAPAAVITEGGQKIGLVAATTQLIESISSPNGTEVKGFPTGPGANGEVDNMDLLAAQLQPIIDEMIASGINKIILMSHLQQIANEQLLATKLKGVDIILSAGSNTRLGDGSDQAVAFPGHEAAFEGTYPIVAQGTDGKTTLIVNTDGEYTYLGRLAVGFDANGEILLSSLDPAVSGAYASTAANVAAAWNTSVESLETTAFADGTKGDQVRDITRAVDAVIAAKDGNIYGYTNVYLEAERAFVRSQETNLGDLSADSGIFVLRQALGEAADGQYLVGLRNGGGIRAQIGAIDELGNKVAPIANPDAGKPAGGVSQLDVENALRFDNKMMVFDTTAAGLKNIIEHSVAAGINQGRFGQIGGVQFSWDPDNAAGAKILSMALVDEHGNVTANLVQNGVLLAGAPSLISVSTTSFTANGGDGYPIKANAENFRFILDDGTLGPAVDEALDFTAPANVPANAMGEQKAFEAYMEANHGSVATAYNQADTAEALDTRIQNVNVRSDAVLDLAGPMLHASNPADNATGVDAAGNIVLTFNEDVVAGSGNITISNGAGDVRVITMGTNDPDGTVTFNGHEVVINLATDLAFNTAYDVIVAAGAIEDNAGNDFAGIAANALDFTTAPVPLFMLQLLHFSDGEAGLLAADTAPRLAALVDAFDDDYANTLILSGGDNFLPGPFINAGTDPSLNSVSGIGATAPGRADIAMLNAIGIEASTIGNHEFDLGSTVFRDAITPASPWGGALFPYLSSNLDFSGDSALNPRFTNTLDGGTGTLIAEASTLKGRIAPSAVITEGGQRIGLVGATTQVLESISSPNGTEVKGFPTGPGPNGEVDNMDLLAAQLQPIIDEMIAEGITKIVLMSHLQQIANEQLLATKLKGVDIILSAGSNTRLGDGDDQAVAFPGHEAAFEGTYPIVTQGTDGKTTLIVNTDGEYTYLGRLVVGFDVNGEIVLDTLENNQPINGAYAATDENVAEAWNTTVANLGTTAFANGTKGDQVRDITQAVDAVIASKDGNVFGFSDVYLEGERAFIRSQETNLGDLSADTGIHALKQVLGAAADDLFIVGLRNGGGIRAQIGAIDEFGNKVAPIANADAGKPAGGVSQLDVENALRFDNKLMVFDTNAAGLKAILEHSVAAGINQGRFGQVGGLRFSWDPDFAVGSKVMNISLVDESGAVVARVLENGVVSSDAPSVITVSTTSFTANGGDGYPIKANGSNFRFLLTNGTLGMPVDESLDFTTAGNTPSNALGEQAAFEDYMMDRHGTVATAFDIADTAESLDVRIQNLNVRSDAVFQGTTTSPPSTGGADTITGTAGDDVLNAGDGNDLVSGGDGADRIDLGSGADTLRDRLGDLNGDVVSGFGLTDTLDITGIRFERGQATFTQGASQTVVKIGDTSFTLAGSFSDGDFMAVSRGTGANMHTIVTYEPFLPTLTEGVRVDPAKINGVTNELFLTGDGNTKFGFEFLSGVSAHSNTLGYYRVGSDGVISDVHVLIDNTTNVAASARTFNFGTLADNQKLAFFLIQDGNDVYGHLADNLSFVAPGTATPHDIDTGLPPVLRSASLGNLTNAPIFHSIATLNPGDANQVLSGVTRGGLDLRMGFEDLPSATGDNDFQDVVFRVFTDDLLV